MNPKLKLTINRVRQILRLYDNNQIMTEDCFGRIHDECNKTMIDLCSGPQEITVSHPVLDEADLQTRIEYDRGKIDIKEVAHRVKNAWRDKILSKAQEEAAEILKKESEK